jgi:phosphoserine phosphatase
MIYNAKLSRFRIAFHAKPTVKKASSSISSLGLDGVLYLLGTTIAI